MAHTIRWKRMKYGTGERYPERYMAVLFIHLLATVVEED